MIGSDGIINVKEIYGTPVIVDILPKKSNYSKWIKKDNEYLTNHNTGNASKGANALMHAKYLKNLTEFKSWHITIDDKYIIQHLPLNVNAWHCTDGIGSDSGNMNSIGIEGCMNSDGDWSKTRINMIKFNVWCMNNLPNLVGDNWKKTIVPHKHWYNKNCPSVILSESGGFDKFVNDCITYNSNIISIKNNEKWMDILKKVSPIYYSSWISFVNEHHKEGIMNVKGIVEVLFEYNLKELEKTNTNYTNLKTKIKKLWDEYNEKFKSIT